MQDAVWNQVNSVGVVKHTVTEIKEKWPNMVKKTKTEVTIQKTSKQKTGGGPSLPLSDTVSEDIAGLFSYSAAFYGIPGAMDVETMIFAIGQPEENFNQGEIDADVLYSGHTLNGSSNETFKPVQIAEINTDLSEAFSRETSVDGSGNSAKLITVVDGNYNSQAASTADLPKDTCISFDNTSGSKQKRAPKNLKELQMEFYTVALNNQKEINSAHPGTN